MRHRIGGQNTGLGNPNPEILENKWSKDERLNKVLKAMFKEVIPLYFSKWGGVDFKIRENRIEFGIEPAYQYEKLLFITIDRNINESRYTSGIAWGAWGSELAIKERYYGDYKYKSKFCKFIDKWHKKIYVENNK